METITIKLTEEESRGFKKYALLNNISLPALFKRTLEEKMETELDMQVIAEYEKNDSHETYTYEEVNKNLDV